MIKGVEVRSLEKHINEKGFVYEILRPEHVNAAFGQIYISTAKAGFVKANHYHTRKKEWFAAIKGEALVLLKDMETGEEAQISVNGSEPKVLFIPPNVAHAFKNTGKGMLYLLVYISEGFNPADADTHPVELL
ncbi:MAG: WxcM-like domain-containing protein [Candidatus Aenigmarchaeota archaeon]|nr:WxcM-like domain-containing protein [Candidatus Aenigmarchaeota archaeon]